jgi:hypothetical protein
MKSVLSLAIASLCLGVSSARADDSRIEVSGSITGSGMIVGFSVDEEGNDVFTIDESGNYAGSLIGTYSFASIDLERAVVDMETGAGTYKRTVQFSGTANGTACSFDLEERGTIDFMTLTFEGHWHIKNATCGVKGQGSVGGTLEFSSQFEYTSESVYAGWIRF